MAKDVGNIEFVKIYLKQWLSEMQDKNACVTWNISSAWTNTHLSILYKLAFELGYCCEDRDTAKKENYAKTVQQEYYQVDFSLYRHIKNSYWNLDYAIEHENEKYNITKNKVYKGWFDEFAKLLPLKCRKARVVIGYDYFDCENLDNSFERKIENCLNLLNDKDVQQSTAESPILLIIFPGGKKMKQILQGEDSSILRVVEFTCKRDGNCQNWYQTELTDRVIDQNLKENLVKSYRLIKG